MRYLQERETEVEYYEAPVAWTTTLPSVFLAGGITDCPDWQAEVRHWLAGLPVAVLNPRREDFPIGDPSASEEQISWEFDALMRASIVMFWFPKSPSLQPIALYELGRYAALRKPIIVGRDPDYLRAQDVDIQMRLARPEIQVHSSLSDVAVEIVRVLGIMRQGSR